MRHVVLGLAALLLFALPAHAQPKLGAVLQVEMANEVAQLLGLPSPRGTVVMDVYKNGAADKAGLKRLDVLLELAGRPVSQASDAFTIFNGLQPGSQTQARVWRDRAMLTLTVDVPAAPPPPATADGARGCLCIQPTQEALTPRTVELLELSSSRGAVAFEVRPGGVADKAGVKRLDVLLSLDGRPIATGADLQGMLTGIQPGSRVNLLVWRDRGYVQLTLEF
jgi:S1-C subfamily serine protease